MHKKIWKDKEAVSPVIATILMVAITVVLAGVLVVYMQQFSQGPGETVPKGTFIALTFANPNDGVTMNGGGWSVKVQTISGSRPMWASVSVTLQKSGASVVSMATVKASVADLAYEPASGAKWYASQFSGSTVNYVEGGAAQALSGNEANLDAGEFNTVEGLYFIVLDNDGDNKMNNGDTVFVFKDYDSDGKDDMVSGDSIAFSLTTGEIGAANFT